MDTFLESTLSTSVLAAPKHILVATDLEDSEYLIPHVISQAKASKAHVTLVHVMPSDLMPVATKAFPDRGNTETEHGVRLMMTGMMRSLESQGITCDFVSRRGFVADVIREELARTGAGRLIIATHGRGMLGQLALGSVAKELLTSVDVPVFTVGPLSHAGVVHFTPNKILHPVSLNGHYQKRVAFAFDIARIYGSELTLLHVLDSDVKESINPQRTFNWTQNALDALVTTASELTPRVQTRVEVGNTVKEILRVASEEKTDWIILGVDGTFPFSRFWDSAAYKALSNSPCPVLTLRHEHQHEQDRVREQEDFSSAV